MTRTGALAALAAGAAMAGCVALSNWAIRNVGRATGGDGPHVLPVAPGLDAPSGVLLVGAALILRDVVHQAGGLRAVAAAVAAGAAMSAAVAPRSLVLASVVTYAAAEAADTGVFARLRYRGIVAAAVASNVVASALDTVLFLTLAFGWGSVGMFGAGQMTGKLESTAAAAAVLWAVLKARSFRRERAARPRSGAADGRPRSGAVGAGPGPGP